MPKTVAVLGAGSWGTALAVHLGRVGHDVRLWARDRSFAADMASRRANAVYLPDVTFPSSVSVSAGIEATVDGVELVICAVPSHGARAVIRLAAPLMTERAILVSAAKGLEADTHLRVSEVMTQEVGPQHPIVVLSGPSFAQEVAQ
ncbi:MAG TPA: 2-dehydropantoate 2-reductase N-terminal domain-containing protein, partial [Vicinamibacterales bacterium]|nr:2-dehydropantoate 2-reductase N-terminal domain-containing protein [Vicinamibacterales bacterium]